MGNLLSATKRPVRDVDFGFVGDITPENVNLDLLQLLIDNKIVPVINAITHDQKGTLLNTNADTIATTLASALATLYAVDLLFVTDKPGVLADPNDPTSFYQELHKGSIIDLFNNGTITGGMMPKLENAITATHCWHYKRANWR